MVDRRKFLGLGVAISTLPLLPAGKAHAKTTEELEQGGKAYSHYSGTQLTPVASTCGQCPSHCAIVGYLDEGILVKIEGQPKSIRNLGKVCAKGQAGVQKVYDPDRVLFPLRRVGRRGEEKWEKISWDTALGDLASRLKTLRDAGQAEKFVFHHGWIPASARALIDEIFLPAYGTASIIDQTCQGYSARWTALELTWGARADNWDFDNTDFVLNFGSNVLEADTNHVSLARRLALAITERHVPVMTFDVRLSNTAARSTRWFPIRPGTDGAVALAMANVVMSEELYRGAGEDFLKFCLVTEDRTASAGDKVAALQQHLEPYTPEWAEEISGVAAAEIADIARKFAAARSACVISSRGASAHFNGVQTEAAIQMLAAITGNIDTPGGRCPAITPEWIYPTGPEDKPKAKKIAFIDDDSGAMALPDFAAGHNVLNRLAAGAERPGVYMWYHHNPAYANSHTKETIDILKDESLLPFTVAVTPFYDETAALADLILPDATYLERYDIEDGVSPNQVAEYSIRQPMVAPQGEARDFKDVCLDLAKRMGFPLGIKSAEKFVAAACKLTPVVKKKARGFRGMKKNGVWHDKKASPVYGGYREVVSADTLAAEGVIFDPPTGVYWNWRQAGIQSEAVAVERGYLDTNGAHRGYLGQRIGDVVYKGFAPGKLNKSGYFELYSTVLPNKGLPLHVAIPEHRELTESQLILTTFKANVQTLSNTGNDSWLAEIQHDNPAWINPQTAAARKIVDGDLVRIKSPIGEIEAVVMVTPAIAPGVVAISTHAGRWRGGRYAAGEKAPFAIDDPRHDAFQWWQPGGAHANRIIAADSEPVSGQQRWMDTVVEVTKIEPATA